MPPIPPLNSVQAKKNMKSPSAKNQQNGPDNVESVDMEMSDEDMEEYHNSKYLLKGRLFGRLHHISWKF